MGFNCAVGALSGADFDDLAAMGIVPTGVTTSGDDALADDAVYAAVRGDHLLLASADPRLSDAVLEVARHLELRGVGAAMGSAADVHVLQIVDGPRERLRVMAGGVVEVSEGDPWPEEAAFEASGDAEEGLLETLARLTGVRLDDEWMNQEFRELDWSLDEEAADESTTETLVEEGASRYVDLSAVRRGSGVVAVLLGIGLVVEAAFGVISQTHDQSLGLLVPHVVFAALAALTLAVGRLDAARLVWMTASAAVLLVSVIVTMVGGSGNVPILLVFSGYLALLTAVLVWHAAAVRALGRAMAV